MQASVSDTGTQTCFTKTVNVHTFELYLRIKPEAISWLKFIVEGYDGLAVVSTVSAKEGLVRVWGGKDRFPETIRLLENIAHQLTPYYIEA